MVKTILVAAFLMPFSAMAIRPPVTTECMTHSADAVVLARFTGSSDRPVYQDRLGELYLGNFDNLGAFKGFGIESMEFKAYSLLWRKGKPEYPGFAEGKTYLLYLKYSEIGPYVLSGSRGAVEVNKKSISEVREVLTHLGKPTPPNCKVK